MRTLLRVGGITGSLAGAAALALAPWAGIAVAALIVVAGLAAGLATAKWLPSAWYGRQLGAGLRSGLLACVIAVPATLIALLDLAPRPSAALPIGSAALVPVTSLGGGLAEALTVAVSAVAALVVAALSARTVAHDKSSRFVKAVARAREASQPLHEESIFAPALVRRTAIPLAAAVGGGGSAMPFDRPFDAHPIVPRVAPLRRTLVPVTPPEGVIGTTASQRAADPPVRRTIAPAARALPPEPEPQPTLERPHAAAPQPPAPAAAPAPAAPALKRRGGGRPQAARLTPEMIEALAAWARDTDEGGADAVEDEDGAEAVEAGRPGKGNAAAAAREPVESTYLNTPAPAPKRKRKKNATRDWIC